MLRYNPHLKQPARTLRTNMTDSERLLWARLRRKQIHGVQFYPQKPIDNYIVDFYAPGARLALEVDGSQHLESEHAEQDRQRTTYLNGLGLRVLRFNNVEVLRRLDGVIQTICDAVVAAKKIPLGSPLTKGEAIRDGHR